MRVKSILVASIGGLALAACAQKAPPPVASAPPPGSVSGSTAADRDGDGIVDGYYTSDGMYHPNYAPPPPPPVTPSGERG